MKYVLLVVASFLYLSSIAQNGFTVKVTFKNITDKATVALSHDGLVNTATVTPVKNGKFTATGAVSFAGRAFFNITENGKTKTFEFFLGNENITVLGDAKNENSIAIKGGKHEKAFAYFGKEVKPVMNKIVTLVQTAGQYQSNQQKMDSIIQQYNTYVGTAKTALQNLATKFTNSPVTSFALYTLKDLYGQDLTTLNSLVTNLTDEASTNAYAEALKSDLEAKLFGAEGSMAMDFTQNDTADKPVKLSDFRGKYVLIDFWASWCGPCRNENPNVVAAFNKFKEKNFTVLGVSLDRPGRKADWINAIKDDGLTWTNVSDLKFWQNEAAKLYKVQGIPQNFLVGPDGKIVGKNLRGQALEEKLCQLLGCN